MSQSVKEKNLEAKSEAITVAIWILEILGHGQFSTCGKLIEKYMLKFFLPPSITWNSCSWMLLQRQSIHTPSRQNYKVTIFLMSIALAFKGSSCTSGSVSTVYSCLCTSSQPLSQQVHVFSLLPLGKSFTRSPSHNNTEGHRINSEKDSGTDRKSALSHFKRGKLCLQRASVIIISKCA